MSRHAKRRSQTSGRPPQAPSYVLFVTQRPEQALQEQKRATSLGYSLGRGPGDALTFTCDDLMTRSRNFDCSPRIACRKYSWLRWLLPLNQKYRPRM
jgi:hypothetical protein